MERVRSTTSSRSRVAKRAFDAAARGPTAIVRDVTLDAKAAESFSEHMATDHWKAARVAADEGTWDTVTAEEFHRELNRNEASVTLTPYSVDTLREPSFKLFKLHGADIYFAMNGKDLGPS